MSELDTAPAAETDIAESPPSISDLLTERHKPQASHEAHREVGDEPADEALAALAAKAPKPEPTAAAPAAAAPAAPAEIDPATDPKAPKWYRDHMAKTNRELAALRAERAAPAPQPAPRPAAPPAELPNPATDPQGYHDAIQRRLSNEMQQFQLITTLNMSERFARQARGAEKFEECKAWLSTKPDIEAWAIQQPDPWAAAFTQYTREQLAEEIGDDPNAWRESERQRLRDEIRAEMQADQGGQPAPARQPPQMRAAPPAPASTARAAAPRDESGRFAPAPLNGVFKNKF